MMIYKPVDNWRDKRVYYSQEKLSLRVVNTENYCRLLSDRLYGRVMGENATAKKDSQEIN